jgi:hypothetical protein
MSTQIKVTAAQYDSFLKQPENSSRRFELIHGEIIEKMLACMASGSSWDASCISTSTRARKYSSTVS